MVDKINAGTILLDGSTVFDCEFSIPLPSTLVAISVSFGEPYPYRVCIVDDEKCPQCCFRFNDIKTALEFYEDMVAGRGFTLLSQGFYLK
jgi:hypothetical protein